MPCLWVARTRLALSPLLALAVAVLGPAGTADAAEPAARDDATRERTARATVPASWRITGSGFGHGVGMSQYGAFAMAVGGATTEQILEYYYSGTEVGTANNPWSDIAVQVFGSPGDARTTTVALSSGEWRLRASADATTDLATGGPTRRITLDVADGRVRARVKEAGEVVATVTRATLVLQWTGTRAWPVSTPGVVSVAGTHGRYRHGTLAADVVGGRLNVVNHVRINDEYLYGIDEMPSLWGSASMGGSAALRAQVIVARNYAILAKTRNPEGMDSCACHVYDDTRSQNFEGWLKENGEAGDVWTDAVDATRQDASSTVSVLRGADSAIVETPFFARSGRVPREGGGTADNRDVFGTRAQPHLVHRADPYSSAGEPDRAHLSWSDSLTQARARRIFGLRRVAKIVVVSRYTSGQVRTLKAVAPSGSTAKRTKTADGWRVALGVKGSWIVGFAARR